MTNEHAPVEQRDREVAAEICEWYNPSTPHSANPIRKGELDDHPMVQVIARHRTACTPTAVDGDMVEQVKRAVMVTQGCGATIDGERVFCDDERLESDIRSTCDCGDVARAALSVATQSIRAKALEDAAKVAETYSSIHVKKRDDALATGKEVGALSFARQAQTCDELAAAIRSLKGEQSC